ncbi:MAG: DUF1566 domain-containing protein [Actinobacteria bacterium]|uniref:Unannotated protein n=1 Tax=freshwater metagenome TaxID=449393 RepID=A0A6J7VY73_9ZZZZ|nr:DUF1566 domain-containing protein [Actinomycetota bacterium]MSX71581.1 DUF1566 domain-containing protein [Actinomycetota bacterium]MSY69085.1 DUF1566 domain-containing protein [Actinomycetota bacterium]MTA75526.1 DUF1566 domain-containing protein [Actinomycetota bacterium]
MPTLKFGDFQPSPNRIGKPLKLILGIAALASVLALSSTLAANINLNGGGNVEFGQGVAATTACDDQITITPYSTFINEQGAGSHKLTSIKISGIDSRADKCSGKIFVIKAYSDTGQLDLFNYTVTSNLDNSIIETTDYDLIEISDNAGVFTWSSGGTDVDDVTNDANVGDPTRDLTDTSFTLSLTSASTVPYTISRTPLASAEDVKRITVETKGGDAITYALGDIGPGGGIVYYYDEIGFSCGSTLLLRCHYLEYARDKNWKGANGYEPGIKWAESELQGTEVGSGAQHTSIGSGFANSKAIVDQGNGIETAAGASREYKGGGKEDWYLPSRDELNQLCIYVQGLGVDANGKCIGDGIWLGEEHPQGGNTITKGFEDNDYYWNSTELASDAGQSLWFINGSTNNGAAKGAPYHVRPIRSF